MAKSIAFTLDDESVITVEDVVGTVAKQKCPECEEGTLVLAEQTSGHFTELYLECQNDECARCFYQ